MRLINAQQEEVKAGDTVTSFRGEPATVISMTPPHKPGSTGRVYTTLGEHFPGVYDLKWVQ